MKYREPPSDLLGIGQQKKRRGQALGVVVPSHNELSADFGPTSCIDNAHITMPFLNDIPIKGCFEGGVLEGRSHYFAN